MKNWRIWIVAAIMAAGYGVTQAQAQEQEDPKVREMRSLQWQHGPMTFGLGSKATIKLPKETGALAEGESSKFLRLTGNLPSPGMNIIVGGNWWATFEFDDSGYIKDDDRIDADALLKELKESDGPSNEERRKQGLSELITDGWSVPPHYDPATKHLEWGLKLHAADDPTPVINYTVRLLGRTGYERVVLVSAPETLDRDVAEFREILAGFDFNPGEKYSEFRPGDRVAEFGLAALVAGGAAAVATKTGFWKVIVAFLAAGWKFIAAAVVAMLSGFGKLFKRKKDSMS